MGHVGPYNADSAPTSDCRILPIFSLVCILLNRQSKRMLVCYVFHEYPVKAIGAFEMRQIGLSKYEQQLSERTTEALKQMTELRQLRELVRWQRLRR
jgi:hypothetical protein